jgi:hypothetical protein
MSFAINKYKKIKYMQNLMILMRKVLTYSLQRSLRKFKTISKRKSITWIAILMISKSSTSKE